MTNVPSPIETERLFVAEMLAVFAEFEREILRDRVKALSADLIVR